MDITSSHIILLQKKNGKRNRKLINTIAIFRLPPSFLFEKVNSTLTKKIILSMFVRRTRHKKVTHSRLYLIIQRKDVSFWS